MAVLTGLPLFWAEGAAGGLPHPADGGWRAVLGGRAPRAIDVAADVPPAALLLAIQPRDQSPADLAALDRWVRGGGRLLWLADPDLRRTSLHPPGHPLEPPRGLTLLALLHHWGIAIDPPAPGPRRIGGVALESAGEIAAGAGCTRLWDGAGADCRIGRGRAILIADADLIGDPAGQALAAAAFAALADGRPVAAGESDGKSWAIVGFAALALAILLGTRLNRRTARP